MRKHSLSQLSSLNPTILRRILIKDHEVEEKKLQGKSKMQLIDLVCQHEDAAQAQAQEAAIPALPPHPPLPAQKVMITDANSFAQAGLKKGDVCHLTMKDAKFGRRYTHDDAVFVAAYRNPDGFPTGLVFHLRGVRAVVLWEDIDKCWKA